ncbi:MAG TPA: type II toxin-antitoxin system RelE/ParE family toxin [Dongiaceae bacterium]|nr:type II toxin-antitoxin system RelE/ParE family toxin [Dongiaceae bacterium]
MIRSWRNAATRKVWEGERPNRFAGVDLERAVLLLDILDSAASLQAIMPLRSIGLHKLKADRKGQWAMTVNGRWRICFTFADGHAFDVELVDYHRG